MRLSRSALWACRFPHGKRGLKFRQFCEVHRLYRSLPSWEAWIEVFFPFYYRFFSRSLPSWEAWIEVGRKSLHAIVKIGRFPHGKRGLKYYNARQTVRHPLRRFPHGKRGLKSLYVKYNVLRLLSLPSWEAWIEVAIIIHIIFGAIVASLMGSVD